MPQKFTAHLTNENSQLKKITERKKLQRFSFLSLDIVAVVVVTEEINYIITK